MRAGHHVSFSSLGPSYHHPYSASPSVPRFVLVRVSSVPAWHPGVHTVMACSGRGWSFAQAPQSRCQSRSHGIFLAPGRPTSKRRGAHLGTAKKNQCLGQIAPHTPTPDVSPKWANFASTAPAMPTAQLLPPTQSLNEVPCRWFEWVRCANAARTKNEIWNLSTRERRRQPIKKPRRVAARLQEANLIHACHDERETSNPTAPTHAASPKQAATDPTLRLRLRMRLQPDLHRLGDRLVAAPVLRSIIPPCRFALLPVSPALLLEAPPSPPPASWPYDGLGGA